MPAMIRCPKCDSFVKPASLEVAGCPFCVSAKATRQRNPVPGLVLAAAAAFAPGAMAGCSDTTDPIGDSSPVYGIALDAGPADASPGTDGAVYGIAPDAGPADAGEAEPSDAGPKDGDAGINIYGIAPE